MLIGGEDISNDVITLARVFKVCLHSRPFPRRADWRRESFERACSQARAR